MKNIEEKKTPIYAPKRNCWACRDGVCLILNETYCEYELHCAHFKTKEKHEEDLKKSQARLESIGYKPKK